MFGSQLLKIKNKEKVKIFPKTHLGNVFEKETNIPLNELLNNVNSYYIKYSGDIQKDRLHIPIDLRRKGLFVTYVTFENELITEYYNYPLVSDNFWQDNNNWIVLKNVQESGLSDRVAKLENTVDEIATLLENAVFYKNED